MTGAGSERTAPLVEVFRSYQGEGIHVGRRQIFVRFFGCHRNCVYCDTPESVTARNPQGAPASCRVENQPGSNQFQEIPNPVRMERLLSVIDELQIVETAPCEIALTGGEPLLHVPFLETLLPEFRCRGWRSYLETTGDLPGRIQPLISNLDVVAADLKLPSATGERERWEKHAAFFRECREGNVSFFVKVVVSSRTSNEEIRHAAAVIADVSPTVPLVLQPLTAAPGAGSSPAPAQLIAWLDQASRVLTDVRIIPQCHAATGNR